MPEIQTIAVLGAGTMGNGIAHVCARSGLNVLLCDVQQAFLDRGHTTIEKNLAREVAKQKLTHAEAAEALKRITCTLDRESLHSADLAIEAATEKFDIKTALFKDLDRILRDRKSVV